MDATNSGAEMATMQVGLLRITDSSQSDIANQEVATLVCNIWPCVKEPPYRVKVVIRLGNAYPNRGDSQGTPAHAHIKMSNFLQDFLHSPELMITYSITHTSHGDTLPRC